LYDNGRIMRCLLIDNYDSFTWNLADQIGRAFGQAPTVLRNDACGWEQLRADQDYDCIVVSPGPGSVEHEADFHVARQAIAHSALPLLGVCLGFQGIAYAEGGRIAHAPQPYHGRVSRLHHDGSELFAGLPASFEVVRYHSLIAAAPLPPALQATAHTDDGLIMALRHRRRPQWGVQFHPESILSEHGIDLIANFRDLVHRHHGRAFVSLAAATTEPPSAAPIAPPQALQLWCKPLDAKLDPETVFNALYAQQRNSFWLDSQDAVEERAACSFMGAVDDEDLLAYRIADDDATLSAGHALLDRIECELAAAQVVEPILADADNALPFDFRGGFIGWLGYEMKALFDGDGGGNPGTPLPDALWMRVHRFLAFDHRRGRAWAIAIAAPHTTQAADAQRWLETVAAQAASTLAQPAPEPLPPPAPLDTLEVDMDLGHDDYLAAIEHCRRAIVDGESYQICLTNHFRFRARLDPLALYLRLRRGNAAPFGAYLRSGDHHVLSTSPERFLRVDRTGRIQTKPIKGTMRRSDDPRVDAQYARHLAESVKDRAENLMIVDLMRNDLNRVAVHATVEVPKLREVESYRTVHQLVSTVEAQLRPDTSLIDLLRATFPGGSISGAPKRRTMQIIDRLERSARGVYCGSIGYLGYNRVADLNIGIRTLSYDGDSVAFGAGGAITWLSDPQAEFQEVLLKAEAVLRPLWGFLARPDAGFAYELDGERLRLHRVAR
jgi:para-aminobenzoate synthetase